MARVAAGPGPRRRSFGSALGAVCWCEWRRCALVITPSLAYMAEATSDAGVGSFGVAYGLYNVAWGVGLLGGPALGGFLFERMGFARAARSRWAAGGDRSSRSLLGRVKSSGCTHRRRSSMNRASFAAAAGRVLLLVLAASPAIRARRPCRRENHVEFAGMLGRMVNLFGGKARRKASCRRSP